MRMSGVDTDAGNTGRAQHTGRRRSAMPNSVFSADPQVEALGASGSTPTSVASPTIAGTRGFVGLRDRPQHAARAAGRCGATASTLMRPPRAAPARRPRRTCAHALRAAGVAHTHSRCRARGPARGRLRRPAFPHRDGARIIRTTAQATSTVAARPSVPREQRQQPQRRRPQQQLITMSPQHPRDRRRHRRDHHHRHIDGRNRHDRRRDIGGRQVPEGQRKLRSQRVPHASAGISAPLVICMSGDAARHVGAAAPAATRLGVKHICATGAVACQPGLDERRDRDHQAKKACPVIACATANIGAVSEALLCPRPAPAQPPHTGKDHGAIYPTTRAARPS